MNTIKALLLPLALIFGAIAVFETGARYGATNMRAVAIANELKMTIQIVAQGQSTMTDEVKQGFALIIDNGIASAAIHRNLWYLKKEAKATLDKVLTFALTARGGDTERRFELMANSEDVPDEHKAKLAEIQAAVHEAKMELVDNARSVQKQEAAQVPEKAAE
jgi:hypothetical protein